MKFCTQLYLTPLPHMAPCRVIEAETWRSRVHVIDLLLLLLLLLFKHSYETVYNSINVRKECLLVFVVYLSSVFRFQRHLSVSGFPDCPCSLISEMDPSGITMAELPYGVREGQGMHSTPLIISVGGFSMRVCIAKGPDLRYFCITYIVYLL